MKYLHYLQKMFGLVVKLLARNNLNYNVGMFLSKSSVKQKQFSYWGEGVLEN